MPQFSLKSFNILIAFYQGKVEKKERERERERERETKKKKKKRKEKHTLLKS